MCDCILFINILIRCTTSSQNNTSYNLTTFNYSSVLVFLCDFISRCSTLIMLIIINNNKLILDHFFRHSRQQQQQPSIKHQLENKDFYIIIMLFIVYDFLSIFCSYRLMINSFNYKYIY